MPQLQKTDRFLFYSTILTAFFGLFMVYSATSIKAELDGLPSWYFVLRQGIVLAVGIVLLKFFKRIPYRKLQTPIVALTSIGLVALLLVIVYLVGSHQRWLSMPLGFKLQPSEFAKPAVILFLAWFITHRSRAINTRYTLIPTMLAVGPVLVLIVIADLGTAGVIAVTAAVMFYFAGLEKRVFVALLIVVVLGGSYAVFSKTYRLVRLIQFVDPQFELVAKLDGNGLLRSYLIENSQARDTNYQVEQAKIAMGSGHVAGLGPLQGRQKLHYLPEPQTDFIYAVVGEEFGLVGTTAVLCVFCLILWRGFRIVQNTEDDFAKYLALGVTTVVFVQAFINITVVVGLAPTKGIPLPLISQGGSSLLTTMILMGMLMNVSENA